MTRYSRVFLTSFAVGVNTFPPSRHSREFWVTKRLMEMEGQSARLTYIAMAHEVHDSMTPLLFIVPKLNNATG